MRETPVGMKCPSCARPEFRSSPGESRRWLAGLSGLLASAIIGALLTVVGLGRFGILVAALVGLVAGSIVRAAGKRRAGLGGTAAVSTACGLALGQLALGVPFGALLGFPFLFAAGVAALAAAFFATR
jgi:hypothetical protein